MLAIPTGNWRESAPVVVHWFRLVEPATAPSVEPERPVADNRFAALAWNVNSGQRVSGTPSC